MTSCPAGSASCVSYEHGSDEYTKLYTYLEFDQLNLDGSVCSANRDYGITPGQSGGTYVIYNSVHHQPFYYHVSAPVSQNCGGSRQFLLTLHIEWLEGNPIKLDDGTFSAINSVRATTTTVPPVAGDTEAQADAAIAAAGLTAAPTYVMSPGPGTVLDQNSPSGTVEPTGSPVRITVSLGQVTVPYVLYEDLYSAEQEISNAGLAVGNVSYTNNCVDPGTVQVQDPSSGVREPLGTPVNVEVSTCSSSGGGGGGGSGGSGNPIQPK